MRALTLWTCAAGLCVPALLIPGNTAGDAASARRKVQAIEAERLGPGARVTFSNAEINAYAAEQVRTAVGDAIRNTKIDFSSGRATGSALVDFLRLQSDRGEPPGMMLRWLLRGEKPISVTVRFQSAHGEGQVDVEQVAVSGVPISGRALDLLIDYYLRPRYPEIAIGEPFELRHRVDRIDLTALGVLVRLK
ncbi:MAG: hypothetical protein R2762_27355 [Bryobacteraceae bacterium]